MANIKKVGLGRKNNVKGKPTPKMAKKEKAVDNGKFSKSGPGVFASDKSSKVTAGPKDTTVNVAGRFTPKKKTGRAALGLKSTTPNVAGRFSMRALKRYVKRPLSS